MMFSEEPDGIINPSSVSKDSFSEVSELFHANTRRPTKYIPKTRIGRRTTYIYDAYIEPEPIVLYDNIDVTPKIIYSSNHKVSNQKHNLEFEGGNLVQRKSRSSKSVSRGGSGSIVRFGSITEEGKEVQTVSKRITTRMSLDAIGIDKSVSCDVGNEVIGDIDSKAPSSMYLPRMSSKMIFPSEIRLFLEETETVYLFEMPSVTVIKGSAEGDEVEQDNENYDFLTTGKGRNRKTVTTEAQTLTCIMKTRHTIAPRNKNVNNAAFASVWDMFDSYGALDIDSSLTNVESEEYLTDKIQVRDDIALTKEESNLKTILNSTAFNNAAMMMERILAHNNFMVEQENFKGLIKSEDDIMENSYEYKLLLLWKFQYYKIENRAVTSVSINTGNTDIIAVGYGKFLYSEITSGTICVWSIKNPTQPERLWTFDTPLTSLAFSKNNPNLLAAGFYNGSVLVLDILSYEKRVIAQSTRKSSPSYQPILHVQWFHVQDYKPEQVLSIGQDGRINYFEQTKTKDFVCKPLMRIFQTESNVKSIYEEDWCATNDIPILRNAVCNFYCPHPSFNDIYFIGTSEGYIYKCSKNYLNQHLSFFLAHDGPVYNMQYSYHCCETFLTCGADWTVKVWREGVESPLVVLTTDMHPVMGAVFSPTHSTIITAISGTMMYVWNIKQKIETATLIVELPSEVLKLTKIVFTDNGKNIIISDLTGGVHMYSLLGVLEETENQKDIFEKTLQQILQIRPALWQQIEKLKKNAE